jgi:hypothetical protein
MEEKQFMIYIFDYNIEITDRKSIKMVIMTDLSKNSMNFFKRNRWSIGKIVLFIVSIIILFVCGYFLLKEPLYRLPISRLTIYNNEIKTVDIQNPISPIKIPYNKIEPFTFSYWMNFRMTEDRREMNKAKPKGILYIGDGSSNTLKNNVLLIQSLKMDTMDISVGEDSRSYREDSLGYQMINEVYLRDRYKNTNNNGMIRYRVNEWVFYTYIYLENTIQIYQNGNLLENILYQIPKGEGIENYKIYFTMPEVARNNFDNIPKRIYNIKWYNKILTDDIIKKIYREEKKQLENLLNKEKNLVKTVNNRCSS